MKWFAGSICIFWLGIAAQAQDTHYGTHQFGTRAALMGGAIVGGARDNAVLFYNPAAVAFIDSASFSINANLYQAENIHIKNVLTDSKDFKSLQLSSVPLLTSGQFKTKLENLRISYGIFSPVMFQFRGLARVEGSYPVVPDSESPGNETFVGDENLFTRLREIVVAPGASYKFSKQWSVGLTNLFYVRTHEYNRALFTRYILNDANGTSVSTAFTQAFNYYHVRYVPKIGVAFRNARWSWGATFTAPGISVLGSGAVGVDVSGINVKSGAARSTITANSRQLGVKAHFKSPYSVATGVQWQHRRTGLGLSVQYFGKQAVYNVMQGTDAPFVRPASAYGLLNGDNLLQVKTAARPVLNVALGLGQELSSHVSLNAGIRNNQSYYDPQLLNQNGIKPDITTWDLYHATGGVTISKERSSMSVGLALGFGSDKKRSDQYLPQPSETPFFQNNIINTQATFSSLGILLGYNYFFRKG